MADPYRASIDLAQRSFHTGGKVITIPKPIKAVAACVRGAARFTSRDGTCYLQAP
jgi:hypothetical protein